MLQPYDFETPLGTISPSTLSTDHGTTAFWDTALQSSSPALLVIHGNSSCSKVFKHILTSPIASTHRILAFDLPGHGASSDAPLPERSYTMRGYAEVAVELLQHLKISSVIVLGWSLGGHIGLEMIPLLKDANKDVRCTLAALIMVGTPPALGPTQVSTAFNFTSRDPHMGLAGKEIFTKEETEAFARDTAGAPYEPWMLEAVARADGKARSIMWGAFFGGVGVNQVGVCAGEEGVLLGVVNGGAEPFINLDYIDQIKFRRLWRGKQIRLSGLGHAPFWEGPGVFLEVLEQFLGDVGGV